MAHQKVGGSRQRRRPKTKTDDDDRRRRPTATIVPGFLFFRVFDHTFFILNSGPIWIPPLIVTFSFSFRIFEHTFICYNQGPIWGPPLILPPFHFFWGSSNIRCVYLIRARYGIRPLNFWSARDKRVDQLFYKNEPKNVPNGKGKRLFNKIPNFPNFFDFVQRFFATREILRALSYP